MRITHDQLIPADDDENINNIYFLPTLSWIQSREDVIKFFTSYDIDDDRDWINEKIPKGTRDTKCRISVHIHVVPRMECFDTVGLTDHEDYFAYHQFPIPTRLNNNKKK